MKKIIVVGILVLTVAMTAPAMAFEKGTIRLGAGTGVLSTGGGLSTVSRDFDAGGDQDMDTLALGGGYFFTDKVELTIDFANVDLGGGGDINTIGVGGRYYFPMGKNSLFAGGGFRFVELGNSNGDAIFVTGGYNYLLRDYFSVDFYLTLGQGDLDGNDFNLTDLGITYSVYFK